MTLSNAPSPSFSQKQKENATIKGLKTPLPLMCKRYVALFQCVPTNERPALLKFLSMLSDIAKKSEDVWQAFTEFLPAHSAGFLLNELTHKAGLQKASRGFCDFLAVHRRLSMIPLLVKALTEQHQSIFICTAASPLSRLLETQLRKTLSDASSNTEKKETALFVIKDSGLFAGGTLLHENRFIDASLRGALKRLESNIIKNTPPKGSSD